MPAAVQAREQAHWHGVQHLVADDDPFELRGKLVQPLHATSQVRRAGGQRFLLAYAQLARQFDDLVGLGQRTFGFQREQQVRREPARAGAEFEHARQVHGDQRRELACQRAGEEGGQLRGGDEVAAVPGIAAELGGAATVVAEPGGVERQRHVAIEANPAAGGLDGVANTGGQGRGGVQRVGGGKG